MLSALASLRKATSASMSAEVLIHSGALMGLGYTTASGLPTVGPSGRTSLGRLINEDRRMRGSDHRWRLRSGPRHGRAAPGERRQGHPPRPPDLGGRRDGEDTG